MSKRKDTEKRFENGGAEGILFSPSHNEPAGYPEADSDDTVVPPVAPPKPPTTQNMFCPTGPGGGVDPGCGEGHGAVDSGTHKAPLVTKEIQRYAEEHNESHMAHVLGGKSLADNEPIDIGTDRHGVELKTVVVGSRGRIDMNAYAKVRKVNWEKETGKTYHTVVLDDTHVFNANGPGQHDTSKRVIYYRRGVAGSVTLDSLHKVSSEAELHMLMNMDEKKLPSGAKRTDGELRKGTWRAFEDGDGKGFRNQHTKEIVRAKK